MSSAVSAPRVPHRIVFANEKGGTGKSTTAVHVAMALAAQGAKVAAIDLDPRQRTLHRYLENRAETMKRRGIALPMASFEVFNGASVEELDALTAQMGEGQDFLIYDTPGRDDAFARLLEHEHLPEARNVVDARIRPRVRQEYEASLQLEANAVGHVRPKLPRRFFQPGYCWVWICPS